MKYTQIVDRINKVYSSCETVSQAIVACKYVDMLISKNSEKKIGFVSGVDRMKEDADLHWFSRKKYRQTEKRCIWKEKNA